MLSFLKKTSENISRILGFKKQKIKKDVLEDILIEADIGYEIIEMMFDNLGEGVTREELEVALHRFLRGESYYDSLGLKEIDASPVVYLVMGVNGAGKTTTIGKLANIFKQEGKRVLLGAGDTFRAAAAEQLELWGKSIGVEVITNKQSKDPSALAFDTICSAKARGVDCVLIDTAGRLHNQTNLKNELLKVSRTCSKALEGGDFYKILVLDGTQGRSSIAQAHIFNEMLNIDGVIITKLDGTCKGGAIISIIHELKLPILYVGVGEKGGDLVKFDQNEYINGLLDSIFGNEKDQSK